MPASVPTDEIYERYLKKAISEINELGDELARAGDELRVPVVGSGHPLADIMLLKFSPQPSEIQEGVAFFGRSGQAVLKSLQRLHVDPLVGLRDELPEVRHRGSRGRGRLADARALHRPAEARRRDGRAVCRVRRRSRVPALGSARRHELGVIQRFTPTIQALVTPDIDEALDEAPAKTAFWNAFKALGPWWAEQPPY